MLPFIIPVIGGALAAGAVTWFWAQIVWFLTRTLIPWVREKLGPQWGDLLSGFVKWLDRVITPAVLMLKKAYQWIREKLVKLFSTYRQDTPTMVTKTTEQITGIDEKKAVRVVTEEEIPWEELPSEVRGKLIESIDRPVGVDEKREIEKKAEERAGEDGLELAPAT